MKQLYSIAFLILLYKLSNGQQVQIPLKCDNGKIIRTNDRQKFSAGDKITFQLNPGINCCNHDVINIIEGNNPNSAKPLSSFSFFLPRESINFKFICGSSEIGQLTIIAQGDDPEEHSDNSHSQEEGQNTDRPGSINYGNTLQDAIQLAELWKKYDVDEKAEEKIRILLKSNNIYDTVSWKSITYLQKYPKDLFTPIPIPLGSGSTTIPLEKAKEAVPANLSGLFSPTLIIDALGKFAAKRFKQELTIAYLQKFRDTLISPRYEELGILLPRTYHTLLQADVFNYPSFFQSIHENAQTDLYNLPENVSNLVRKREKEIEPQVFPVILASLDLNRTLELRLSASQTVEYLTHRDYIYTDTDRQTTYGNAIRILGIFSKNLHSWTENTSTGWANDNYLTQLVTDQDVFNFWMAILLKKEKTELEKITIKLNGKDENFYTLLNDELPKYRNYVLELIGRFAEIQAASNQLLAVNQSDTLAAKDRFFKYTDAVLGLVETQIKLVQRFSQIDPIVQKRCDQIINIIKVSKDLSAFARSKRFGDALSASLEIFRLIYGEVKPLDALIDIEVIIKSAEQNLLMAEESYHQAKELCKKLSSKSDLKKDADKALKIAKDRYEKEKDKFKDLKKGKINTEILKLGIKELSDTTEKSRKEIDQTLKLQLDRKRNLEFLRLLDKYGNLLVSVANAKDSDQLVAILEKTAAPVQSYRLKRAARYFSASINMYPGIAYGREYKMDETGDVTKEFGQVAAFTTPLGLSLNFGLGKFGTLSPFFSIIDVGAVTAFRLKDNVSILPDLKWKNVYAPGAYIIWGIPKSPLTLGLGTQYGPALRTINDTGTKASYLRVGASLTVDVPLYFVHSRSFGRKGVKWK